MIELDLAGSVGLLLTAKYKKSASLIILLECNLHMHVISLQIRADSFMLQIWHS